MAVSSLRIRDADEMVFISEVSYGNQSFPELYLAFAGVGCLRYESLRTGATCI
jgi:hypothetical protein